MIMEYILIFISAILCKQHRIVAILGNLPVLWGVSKESGDCIGHVGSGGIRAHHRHYRDIPYSEVCARRF